MKRIAALLLISVICLMSLSSCSEEKSSGKSVEAFAKIVQKAYPEADCPTDDEGILWTWWKNNDMHTVTISRCKDKSIQSIILSLDIDTQKFNDLEMSDLYRVSSLGFNDYDDPEVYLALSFLYDTISFVTDSEEGIFQFILDARGKGVVSKDGWNIFVASSGTDGIAVNINYVGEEKD